ncbi:helix-turn-helix transcriptional regulator [uncultured Phenylobacterium sp.]|uniref:helix-turn-helix domain-containing protein n=1 Tax=uncultured Phenylobacterium sp. TaxID=349273 RepID=UPI0025D46D11|nr:helix-turn-helix transcriptional regulator [uncultured Phenylobacterium sp.]
MWTNTEISLHLGQRLGQRRRELRLSLAQVAERCGVSLQQVHKYETGQNMISGSMLFQLALCLDVPASYFFEVLEEERAARQAC